MRNRELEVKYKRAGGFGEDEIPFQCGFQGSHPQLASTTI
jgi:hypothetical protein